MPRCTRARPRSRASPDAPAPRSKLGGSARGRLSPSCCASSAAARRAAARGRVAEPARPGHRCRGAHRRARARVGRGRRQASPAPVRRRHRRAEPSADDRALADRAARQAAGGAAVARASRRRARGRPLERAGARRSRRGRCAGSARTCSPRSSTSTRPSRGCAARATIWLGEALQDQRLVAGIGNMWMAEALWEIQVSPWMRVRDVSDETLRDARRCGAPADAGVARDRPARAPGLPARGSAVPSLRHDRPLARAGRRQPDRVLVSGLPGRRRAAGGVSRTDGGTRTATAPHPARLLSRRVRLPRPGARGRRRPAVRLRGARAAGRAGALRVPPARADVRRVARERARRPRGRQDRARRAPARAGGRDLRARPRRPEAVRGAGALPHRPRLAADLDRRGVRRLRLGRPRVRACVRRARALALRRLARLRRGRAARRHLRGDAGRARRRDPDARGGDRRARAPLARGAGPAPARVRA